MQTEDHSRYRLFTLLVAVALTGPTARGEGTPAFPGAVGQGAQSLGGRGGDVYVVTNLKDYAPHKDEEKIRGSLRHALRSATGPRTIVFNVSGVIHLHEPLELLKDRITVAGQTSPGGVTLWGYPFEVSGAHDVVVRHMRFRCGDYHAIGAREKRGVGNGDLLGSSANAVHVGHGAERVILDHISASWGIDENLSVTIARDVTIQNSIVSEALNESFHAKGPHGYGTLIRGELTPEDQAAFRGGYTFFGNLWAHHRARNPSVAGQQRLKRGLPESARLRTDVNLVNNVVYDWGDQATHRSLLGDVRINLIGNDYVNGPAKKSKHFFRGGGGETVSTQIFQRGNRHDADQDAHSDGEPIAGADRVERAFVNLDPGERVRSSGEPFGFYRGVGAAASADEAYRRVVRRVGASLWRDAIDRRVIESLESRTGGLIDSQEQFRDEGGVLAGIDAVPAVHREEGFDRDADGMPDAFESAHGLDPLDPSDGAKRSLSAEGYTNLEVYLAEAARGEHAAATPVKEPPTKEAA